MSQTSAAYTMVTIYDKAGDPVSVSRLNAHDLTRMGYTWSRNTKIEVAPEPDNESVSEPSPTDEKKVEEPANEPANEPATPDLEKEGKDVGDFDNLSDYLNSFDQAALRVILEEKFGEKAHARTGKDKLVEKIVAYYDEGTTGENIDTD